MASKAAKFSGIPPIAELEIVRLREPVETDNGMMPSGAEGTVVYVHRNGEAFEVEFERPFHAVSTLMAAAVERAPV